MRIEPGELLSHCVDQGTVLLAQPDHPGHCGGHLLRGRHRSELDPPPSVGAFVDHFNGCLQGSAGLATAPGVGKGHETILLKHLA